MPTTTAAIESWGRRDWQEPGWFDTRGRFAAGVGVVLMVAGLIGMSGIRTLPPEEHDIYNAQATYEMYQRGSWLVPYFNGRVRLNKPPLGYWQTAAAAWLMGAGGEIQVWHARLGSAMCGVVAVAAAIALGSILFSRMLGLLAGLMAASAHGMVALSHSGRPDMLYAALCVWQVVMFLLAYRAADRSWGQRVAGWSFWVLAGLAIMAKGPQVPAMTLAAAAGWLAIDRVPVGRAMRVLRPGMGIVLCLAIALPWFTYVRRTLSGAELASSVTGGDELAGENLEVQWLGPLAEPWYYPLMLVRSMLPWVIVLPGLVMVCLQRGPLQRRALMLAWFVLVAMVLFGFGSLRRSHYLTPLLPLTMVLGVAGIAHCDWRLQQVGPRRRLWLAIVAAHAVAAVGVLVWIGVFDLRRGYGAAWATLGGLAALIVATAVACVMLDRRRRGRWSVVHVGPGAIGVIFAMAFIIGGGHPALWRHTRGASDAFAREVASYENPNHVIISFRSAMTTVIYYVREPVATYGDVSRIAAELARHPTKAFFVVCEEDDTDEFPSSLNPRVLAVEAVPERETQHCLLQLSRG